MARHNKVYEAPTEYENTIIYDAEKLDLLIREAGKNIKNERLKRQMSILELSMMTNIDVTHLYRIESGQSKVGIEGLLKIVVAFDMPLDKIIPIAYAPREYSASERFREIIKPLDQTSINCLLYFLEDWVKWQMKKQNEQNKKRK